MHVDDRVGKLAEALGELLIVQLESIGWFHRSVARNLTLFANAGGGVARTS
jgi:hypothetical protein